MNEEGCRGGEKTGGGFPDQLSKKQRQQEHLCTFVIPEPNWAQTYLFASSAGELLVPRRRRGGRGPGQGGPDGGGGGGGGGGRVRQLRVGHAGVRDALLGRLVAQPVAAPASASRICKEKKYIFTFAKG